MLGPRPKKKLGQVFLVNEHIAEIEAVHAEGKKALKLRRIASSRTSRIKLIEKKRSAYRSIISSMSR